MDNKVKEVQESTPLVDSGERKNFVTGASRDIQVGKGRCDLLPLSEVSIWIHTYKECISAYLSSEGSQEDTSKEILVSYIIDQIQDFMYSVSNNSGFCNKNDVSGTINPIYYALSAFAYSVWGDSSAPYKFPYGALLDLSKHFEAGAIKYSEDNWRKGVPMHSFIDSGIRHLLKWADGWEDEPHNRAFVWNMLCMLWTYSHFKCYEPEVGQVVLDLESRKIY